MITIHCTHPDGETSEARYTLAMTEALQLYAPDWTVDRVWNTVADFLGGEWATDRDEDMYV
jgi:hypothetical protein